MSKKSYSIFEPLWPDDIPQECPKCGAALNPKINLNFSYGKAGRLFQWLAWWGSLIWGIFLLLFGAFTAANRWGGFVIGIGIMIPWALFSVLTAISPKTRRVRCFPCNYSKDYSSSPSKKMAEQVVAPDA